METPLIDKLKCPICLEYPEKEIYLCTNGHSLCSVCCNRVTECPTCRTSFTTGRVRNRAMEALLDGILFDCPYKSNGCQEKLNRGVFSNHANTCNYSPLCTDFCKQLGMSCTERLNVSNSKLIIEHMKSAHMTVVKNGSPSGLQIKVSPDANRIHKNVILSNDNASGVLIHICGAPEEGNVLFSLLRLGESMTGTHAVELRVKSPNSELLPEIMAILVPYSAKHADFALRNPCFRVPMTYAVDNCVLLHYRLLQKTYSGGYDIVR